MYEGGTFRGQLKRSAVGRSLPHSSGIERDALAPKRETRTTFRLLPAPERSCFLQAGFAFSRITIRRNHHTSIHLHLFAAKTTFETSSLLHPTGNTMANSQSNLLRVPSELTAHIATHLPKKDLLTLRLVSKETATRTQSAMLDANFRHLHLLFSVAASLERGLSIVKHPELKKGVEKISIYHNRFLIPPHPRSLKLADLRPNTAIETKREVRCTQQAVYTHFAQGQHDIVTTGKDMKLMTDILINLQANTRLEIKLAELKVQVDSQGKHYCRQGGSGVNEFDRLADLYDGDLVVDGEVDHRPMVSVLEAIKSANISLAGFAAGGECQQVPIHMFNDMDGFLGVRQNLAELTSLHICFEQTPARGHKRSEVKDIANFIGLLQRCAPSLKNLSLNMDEDPFSSPDATWNKVFAEMAENVTLPVIEFFNLRNLTADYSQFL